MTDATLDGLSGQVVGAEAGSPTGPPTRLGQVIDVIPPHCYERSTARGLMLLARDVAIYTVAVALLVSTNNPLLLLVGWVLALLSVTGLFILGHDAAHGALFDSKRLNTVVARLSMLPSLHATETWIFGHNRVHHGFTLRQGMDFVWHPITVEEYSELGRFRRLQHRLEWGPFGAGPYYVRNVWWHKMVRFSPPARWAKAMHRDQALIAGFAAAALVAALVIDGPIDGWWTWVKVIVVPFLLFCQVIGWAVYVHHIRPDIRWWSRNEWTRFRGQVEGTTVLIGPPGWEIFFHWIMVHLPHHVDMRIPCYRLREAATAIAEEFPDHVAEERISVRSYLAAVSECKLHDFEAGRWSRYPANASRS